jgi:hypothetical protein
LRRRRGSQDGCGQGSGGRVGELQHGRHDEGDDAGRGSWSRRHGPCNDGGDYSLLSPLFLPPSLRLDSFPLISKPFPDLGRLLTCQEGAALPPQPHLSPSASVCTLPSNLLNHTAFPIVGVGGRQSKNYSRKACRGQTGVVIRGAFPYSADAARVCFSLPGRAACPAGAVV